MRLRWSALVFLTTAALQLPRLAQGAPPNKAACLAAYQDGQVHSRDGQLIVARDELRLCASAPCPPGLAPECSEWLATVERRMPTIVIVVRKSDGRDAHATRVLVDGREVPTDGRELALDPGEHAVRVEGDFTAAEAYLVAAENEKGRLVTLTVAEGMVGPPPQAALPAAEERRRRSVPAITWIAGGVGLAGLASFGVFSALGNGAWSDLDRCKPFCTSDDTRSAKTFYTIGDVSLVLGVVALGVAVVTYLASPRTSPSSR